MTQQINLKSFKRFYASLTKALYSHEEYAKSIAPKLNWLGQITLSLLKAEQVFLVNKGGCGLLLIKNNVGYLGYLEASDNIHYSEILVSAKNYCRDTGIKTLFAPVDLSLWHSHRLFAQSPKNPTARGGRMSFEPLAQSFYKEVLVQHGFMPTSRYFTGYRTHYTKLIGIARQKIEEHKLDSFTVKEIRIGLTSLPVIKHLFELSAQTFIKTAGFYPISFLSFLNLYLYKNTSYKKFLHGLYNKDKLIGFSYCYIEEIENIQSMVFKTIVIDEKYRNAGGALYFMELVHAIAKQHNCKRIYYAYIQEGNKVSQMNTDGMEYFGYYELFSCTIG